MNRPTNSPSKSMGDATGLGHLTPLLQGEGHLEAEELVEDEPAAGRLGCRRVRAGSGCGRWRCRDRSARDARPPRPGTGSAIGRARLQRIVHCPPHDSRADHSDLPNESEPSVR